MVFYVIKGGEDTKLLIIADDFTGALDTGVQFTKVGVYPHILINAEQEFPSLSESDVFVINAATRHLSAAEAYQIVYKIVSRAFEQGFDFVYKKTDSALRGNIGSELTALLEASGEKMLPFFPAYPQLNRCTVNGVHYIDGIKVSESIFGSDPFEPVHCSYIPSIIAQQSKIATSIIREQDSIPSYFQTPTIAIFDCQNTDRFYDLAKQMKSSQSRNRIMAGCAGFAEYLPFLLHLIGETKVAVFSTEDLLVVSGSLNPITIEQMNNAEADGFFCSSFSNEEALSKLENSDFRKIKATEILKKIQKHSRSMIRIEPGKELDPDDSAYDAEHVEKVGKRIANNIGALLVTLLKLGMKRNLIITGGDILHSFINQTECKGIIPLGEIEPGVVISLLFMKERSITLVSKSGGFGSKDVFSKIATFLNTKCLNTNET